MSDSISSDIDEFDLSIKDMANFLNDKPNLKEAEKDELEKSLKFIANFLNDNPRIKKKVLDVMPQKDGDEELLSLLFSLAD